jgi:hypothetical protein
MESGLPDTREEIARHSGGGPASTSAPKSTVLNLRSVPQTTDLALPAPRFVTRALIPVLSTSRTAVSCGRDHDQQEENDRNHDALIQHVFPVAGRLRGRRTKT